MAPPTLIRAALPGEPELQSFARAAAQLLIERQPRAPGSRAVTRRAGVGLQHFDHRDYAPGDEVRHIDWRHTARQRRPIVRRFESESVAAAEALTCACFLGKIRVANYLLQRGVSPTGGMGTGLNAMHWAANRGQVEVVRLLLQWRAPLDVRSMYGGNVLDTAVWSAINEPREGHLAVIDVLLDAGARLEDEQYPTGHEAVDMRFKRHGAV